MIIDLREQQLLKFEQIAQKIMAQPETYLNFDSVADFYQATWLDDFPKGTTFYASGLDDGAEQFYARIELRIYRHDGALGNLHHARQGCYLNITHNHKTEIQFGFIFALTAQ